MIHILVHAPSRAAYLTGMKANGWMNADESPATDVQIDEIGTFVKQLTFGENPTFKTVGGVHANVRIYGAKEAALIDGKAQTDQDGNLLGLFVRTNLLADIPGLQAKAATQEGVPAGYVDPPGLRLFDPALVATPMRVWA